MLAVVAVAKDERQVMTEVLVGHRAGVEEDHDLVMLTSERSISSTAFVQCNHRRQHHHGVLAQALARLTHSHRLSRLRPVALVWPFQVKPYLA